jgi:Anti-sigma factor NepR
MWQAPTEIRRRIGNTLRSEYDRIASEPLPERWVDLIRYLDEKERLENERQELNAPQPGTALQTECPPRA